MRPAMRVCALALLLACHGAAPAGTGAPSSGGGPDAPGSPGEAPGGAAVTFERLDDGGDCAGVVPARAVEPVVVRRVPAPGEACTGGTTDGTGSLALGARGPSGATRWQVLGPDGAPRGGFSADAPLLAQPSGWHAIASTGAAGGEDAAAELLAVGPDGRVLRRELVTPDPSAAVYPRWSLGADPAGGSLAAVRSTALAGNHWSSVVALRRDAAGGPAWPAAARVWTVPSALEPMFLAGGVSTRGDALVLSQRSAFLDVSWLEPRDGAPVAGAAAEQAEPSAPVVGTSLAPVIELAPLLDGGLAVRADGTFRRAYAHRATTSSALPPWLAERAVWSIRFTRGNAAYAALPPAGQVSADCTQRIDLLSASGRLCGRAVLREEGGGCTTGAVDQGWDGTVVQQSGKDACTFLLWPRLLAR